MKNLMSNILFLKIYYFLNRLYKLIKNLSEHIDILRGNHQNSNNDKQTNLNELKIKSKLNEKKEFEEEVNKHPTIRSMYEYYFLKFYSLNSIAEFQLQLKSMKNQLDMKIDNNFNDVGEKICISLI